MQINKKTKKRTQATSVRRQLLRRMKAGFFPNDALPSEEGIANMFGVSRITVRDALAILENQRYISRAQGRETVINPKVCTMRGRVSEGLPFTEVIASYGFKPSVRDGKVEKKRILKDIKKALQTDSEEMYCVEKVFCGDGEPMIMSINHYSTDYVDDRMMKAPLNEELIFKWVQKEFNFPSIAYDYLTINAIKADAYVAGKLGIPEGEAIIRFESVARDDAEHPLLVNYEYYHPGKIQFHEIRAVDYQMEE